MLSFEEKVEERCLSEDGEEKVQRVVEQFLQVASAREECRAFFARVELPEHLRTAVRRSGVSGESNER